jgi:hypothetical protein
MNDFFFYIYIYIHVLSPLSLSLYFFCGHQSVKSERGLIEIAVDDGVVMMMMMMTYIMKV